MGAGEPEFHGRFWSWEAAGTIRPCGAVDPPELLLAGQKATMKRAAKHGLTWQPSFLTPERLAPPAREFRDRGGTRLSVPRHVALTTSPEREFEFRRWPVKARI